MKKRVLMASIVSIGLVAVASVAGAQSLPPHQAPAVDTSVAFGSPNCTVVHWHGFGYCEVEVPTDAVRTFSVYASAKPVPGQDGWRASLDFWAIDLNTGDVIKRGSDSLSLPSDYTPPVYTDPVHLVENAVTGTWPMPSAYVRIAGGASGISMDFETVRIGCFVRGTNTTGQLQCNLRS